MKARILSLFFVTLFFFGISLFTNISTAQAGACPGTAQPSEGLAGIDLFQLQRSIVPCGRNCNDGRTPYNETQNCTLCHLLIMMKNIFDLMFAWMIIVSLVMLTIGGVMYLLSAGNPGTATFAKGILTKTLMGFGGFLVSWLLVYTLLVFLSAKPANTLGIASGADWWRFTCDETTSPFN